MRTALQAMVAHSANDVTVAIAERLAGSEHAFAAAMTSKARQLGMNHTTFANATGLRNSTNLTTARDMVTIARALLKNHAKQYPLFATRSVRWQSQRFADHNHLLGKVDGVDGIKTGYTVDAGYNIATSAKRGGVRVIAVVLGASSIQGRDVRAANLVELGFTPPLRHRPNRLPEPSSLAQQNIDPEIAMPRPRKVTDAQHQRCQIRAMQHTARTADSLQAPRKCAAR